MDDTTSFTIVLVAALITSRRREGCALRIPREPPLRHLDAAATVGCRSKAP